MRYRVMNTTRNTLLADSAELADSFGTRFWGLMGRTNFPQGQGILFVPCSSIHSFFMKIDFDAVFLTEGLVVIDVIERMKPWGMSRIYRKAHSVLELPAGTLSATSTARDDVLALSAI